MRFGLCDELPLTSGVLNQSAAFVLKLQPLIVTAVDRPFSQIEAGKLSGMEVPQVMDKTQQMERAQGKSLLVLLLAS